MPTDRGTLPYWHQASWNRFRIETLPALLADRLPLSGYQAAPVGPITVAVATNGGVVETTFASIPVPSDDGVFCGDEGEVVVLPVADRARLDEAEIACVGEQMLAWVDERLGRAAVDLAWTADLLRSWLPLERWVTEFFAAAGQPLDDRNWLSRREHLRRIRVAGPRDTVAPGQDGRVCPTQTPEGHNVGRFLHVSRGAEIRGGRLEIVDDRPEAGLSIGASWIPFLEHDDPARTLMGANMMRQWIPFDAPERALVRTGHEPDAPDLWCGRDLLTAFVSLGGDTFEDGIVLSESAAARLAPVEIGDKLSNRHGGKGVVARILPDREMPHLADGTPAELVFDFIGCHTRRNFGLIREAIAGRIALAEGEAMIVPPFAAPSGEAIRARLVEAGLPDSGQETLTLGHDGPTLERPSTVGPIYWGRVKFRARTWVQSGARPGDAGLQRHGELEHFVYRDLGAHEVLAATFHTACAEREDAASFSDRLAAGPVETPPPPTPAFDALARRLDAAGIAMIFEGDRVTFGLAEPSEDRIELAEPVPHPWLPERELSALGLPDDTEYASDVRRANERLRRMQEGGAPESLREKARETLAQAVTRHLDGLFDPMSKSWGASRNAVRPGGKVLLSGRAVAVPGPECPPDRVGLAEDIAWTLFTPLVQRKIGAAAAAARGEDAAKVLDQVMEASWVIVNRAPSIAPTTLIAFRPYRIPERAIRIPLMSCWLLNCDFDGDQVAVFLPATAAAQREAAAKLSIEAHVARDPELVTKLMAQDPIWGIASRSRTEAFPAAAPDGVVTSETLGRALRTIADEEGPAAAVTTADAWIRQGLEVTRLSGASMSPFPLEGFPFPERAKERTHALVAERIASSRAFEESSLGPQLLAVQSGARGTVELLARLVDAYVSGLDPKAWCEAAADVRTALARIAWEFAERIYEAEASMRSKGFGVLARAMRASEPGIPFAQAAASGEVDPLTDPDTRIFVGLAP